MSSMSEDIQCAGSDTRPPMLDRTDFESWQQRSSSTENLIESLSNSLALLTQSYKSHLPQTNNQLRTSSNARNKATVQDGRVVVQDVPGNSRRSRMRVRHYNPGLAKPIKCYNCNGLGHIARECPRPKRLQDSDYFKDKMLLMQAQENGAVLDEEQSLFLAGEQIINFDEDVDNSPENDLALNMDHIFEADECDAFDSNVARLSIHEVHEMQTDNNTNYVVDSDAVYTIIVILFRYHYLEDNRRSILFKEMSPSSAK
ncbi:retrovirus-related pol polyprotein from transposon TNT 1-94 [Tanacetum coccineum]